MNGAAGGPAPLEPAIAPRADDEPFVAAPAGRPRRRPPVVHVLLFLATLGTTTIAGALNDGVLPSDLRTEWAAGLRFSLTLMGILLAHEMGHYVAARLHGVHVTLPFFLPGPPILTGTFGAFIRMRSAPQNRRVLFDVGAAGPWAGLMVAAPAVVVGLYLSQLKPIPPEFVGLSFGDSLLFKALARIVVGPVPFGYDIVLHPIALAGWFGFLVTVLNLLPVGQLDGGHVVYAMFGRWHRVIARGFLVATVALGFLGWSGWFLWAVLLLCVGLDHPPTLDRAVRLDPLRLGLGWMTLALFLVTFIPVPIAALEGGAGPTTEELLPASIESAFAVAEVPV
jgi:membrane-associated protease RseP (regulator of RpoE activity)